MLIYFIINLITANKKEELKHLITHHHIKCRPDGLFNIDNIVKVLSYLYCFKDMQDVHTRYTKLKTDIANELGHSLQMAVSAYNFRIFNILHGVFAYKYPIGRRRKKKLQKFFREVDEQCAVAIEKIESFDYSNNFSNRFYKSLARPEILHVKYKSIVLRYNREPAKKRRVRRLQFVCGVKESPHFHSKERTIYARKVFTSAVRSLFMISLPGIFYCEKTFLVIYLRMIFIFVSFLYLY